MTGEEEKPGILRQGQGISHRHVQANPTETLQAESVTSQDKRQVSEGSINVVPETSCFHSRLNAYRERCKRYRSGNIMTRDDLMLHNMRLEGNL